MSLKIIKAGILDTVQDEGRFHYQQWGINPGGVMDRFSASLANALLGNELNNPVIELHFPASQFLFKQSCIICLAGADFSATINGVAVSNHQPLLLTANSLLSFTALQKGARCYLSIFNNLQLEKWLGSYSTNLKANAGGWKGRKLQKEDELSFSSLSLPAKIMEDFLTLPWRYKEDEILSNEIEVIAGNEWAWLTTKNQTSFLNDHFTISNSSDRMGYRLQGEPLQQERQEQLVSSAVTFGTIQLLPNGQLIVLMADHQTTGGYPRIAHVTAVHLPRLAQRNPGDEVRFTLSSIEAAEEKWISQQHYLMQLQKTCNLKMQNWLHAHRH